MLTSCHIENFKSFKELPELSLYTVTVLAGANSSGKSTLIQTILLLKQTIQYGSQDRPLTLNGPLLRLGSFSDIRNNSSYRNDLTVAFDLKIVRIGRQKWERLNETKANQSSDLGSDALWSVCQARQAMACFGCRPLG